MIDPAAKQALIDADLGETWYAGFNEWEGHSPEAAAEIALSALSAAGFQVVKLADIAAAIRAECIDVEWPNDDISLNGEKAAQIVESYMEDE